MIYAANSVIFYLDLVQWKAEIGNFSGSQSERHFVFFARSSFSRQIIFS